MLFETFILPLLNIPEDLQECGTVQTKKCYIQKTLALELTHGRKNGNIVLALVISKYMTIVCVDIEVSVTSLYSC